MNDFIFQQYIAVYNKCTSVLLTDAHLRRTCTEIVYVQPQSCDQTLNNTIIDTIFQKLNNIFSYRKV